MSETARRCAPVCGVTHGSPERGCTTHPPNSAAKGWSTDGGAGPASPPWLRRSGAPSIGWPVTRAGRHHPTPSFRLGRHRPIPDVPDRHGRTDRCPDDDRVGRSARRSRRPPGGRPLRCRNSPAVAGRTPRSTTRLGGGARQKARGSGGSARSVRLRHNRARTEGHDRAAAGIRTAPFGGGQIRGFWHRPCARSGGSKGRGPRPRKEDSVADRAITLSLTTGFLALVGLVLLVNAVVATGVRQCRRGVAAGWRSFRAALGSRGARRPPKRMPMRRVHQAGHRAPAALPERPGTYRPGRRRDLAPQ